MSEQKVKAFFPKKPSKPSKPDNPSKPGKPIQKPKNTVEPKLTKPLQKAVKEEGFLSEASEIRETKETRKTSPELKKFASCIEYFVNQIAQKFSHPAEKIFATLRRTIYSISLRKFPIEKIRRLCIIQGISQTGTYDELIDKLSAVPSTRSRLINKMYTTAIQLRLNNLLSSLKNKNQMTIKNIKVENKNIQGKNFALFKKKIPGQPARNILIEYETCYVYGILGEDDNITELEKEDVYWCIENKLLWKIPLNLNTEDEEAPDMAILNEELTREDFKDRDEDIDEEDEEDEEDE